MYQLEAVCAGNGFRRIVGSKMLNGKAMRDAEKSCTQCRINKYSAGDLHFHDLGCLATNVMQISKRVSLGYLETKGDHLSARTD